VYAVKVDLEKLNSVINFEKIVEFLYDISPIKRELFMCRIKKSKVKEEFFTDFEEIWAEVNITSYKELKEKIKELNNNESKDVIIKNLEIAVDDIGYKNKQHFFEKFYTTMSKLLDGYSVEPEIIYGDTDSVFFCPHIRDNETGELLKDQNALCISIRLGVWASILITTMLPSPMAQEYEKVLWPFVIQGKKRYVGNLYEKDPHSFKQKSMGIELKRRDNAPIVKNVLSGIINKIVNERNSEGAFEFMKEMLDKIIRGDFNIDKFVVTKTLKGNALTKQERTIEKKKPKEDRSYADRTRIVHAVLADRIADRDPGNKPLSNDRIPYAYVELKYEPELQGDRVETPEYIVENKLKLDYLFYITNQIMKPALKFLDLISPTAGDLFKDYIAREENRRRCMAPINYYIDDKSKIQNIDDVLENSELKEEFLKKEIKHKKQNKNRQKEIKKKEISEIVWFDDV
jgi:DNA polymerase elongation subunit (family B)